MSNLKTQHGTTSTPHDGALVPSLVARTVPLAKKIVLTDPGLCRGCDACELVCSLRHEGRCGLELARIHVTKDFVSGEFGLDICRQCQGPQCMFVCPVPDAMYVAPETGARVVDEKKCIGCARCVQACQFSAIRLHRETGVALNCDLCNGEPECVKICPTGALSYGDWKESQSQHRKKPTALGSHSKMPRSTYAC